MTSRVKKPILAVLAVVVVALVVLLSSCKEKFYASKFKNTISKINFYAKSLASPLKIIYMHLRDNSIFVLLVHTILAVD